VQVHHLSDARGFVKVGEVYGYEAELLNEPTDAFTPLAPGEADEAISFCQRTAPGRLMNFGWKFVAPNADSLRAAADDGLAWWWRGRSGVLSAWKNDEDDAPSLTVGFEACAGGDHVKLLEDFRRFASARGADIAGWMNMVNETVAQDLEAAGYKRTWEDGGFLYERSHP